MKLNIANPFTGAQKILEIEDENRLRIFMDKQLAEEIDGEQLGEEFRGFVFKIVGGNDKQGFPMRQGVLLNRRVRLLLRRGMPCYKARRKGEQRRKAVRGCIIGPDIAVVSLVIVKQGEGVLPGLTDVERPRRLGPKRVDKIQKLFNLTKDDDVRDYVIRRKVKTASGKTVIKKPKIQRLVTPTIKHRRHSMKKKLLNRKRRSYENRKAYYERLTNKAEEVRAAVQVKPKGKKGKGGQQSGSAKKGKKKGGQQRATEAPKSKQQGPKKSIQKGKGGGGKRGGGGGRGGGKKGKGGRKQ